MTLEPYLCFSNKHKICHTPLANLSGLASSAVGGIPCFISYLNKEINGETKCKAVAMQKKLIGS